MYKELLLGPIADLPKLLIIVALVWTLFWKGLALWKSAKNNQKYWFVALLVLSTIGVLEIIYLAFFQKKGKK
ncbi:hypothetical protein A3E15_01490 [Candidatus Woesebacteria bacterium RIFCSPHIGHO2_12_FULL_42_9]|uniref:DUF5652 domain-containing protein n=2 Tax=Candidatus Woeseibacteriota TaxID=1752722 RepID=A0A1F8AX81_9BACT|nr:MAG: hypothetical protein A2112_02545 [Candidatus Woesebacteria bacterium GWA1_42_12]OGM56344.1 MAG: hypothetical protein A3E15_01490 [Candidatus Woesebacteria bacterium RIFCSPHIGHO2_12_FULL_42_9]